MDRRDRRGQTRGQTPSLRNSRNHAGLRPSPPAAARGAAVRPRSDPRSDHRGRPFATMSRAAAASRAVRLRALDGALPACSAPTSRTSGTAARSTARSAGARCGSRRRPAGSTSSRSTSSLGRWSTACSARRSTSTPSTPGPRRSRSSHRSSRGSPGFARRSSPDPFEASSRSITAQQVSLFAAFAIRSRFVERFGDARRARLRVPDPRAARGRDRGRALRARLLAAKGRVRRRACAQRPRPRRARRASTTTRSAPASSPSAGSAPGRPNGSSRATSPGRGRGRQATWRCARRSSLFTVRCGRSSGTRLDPFQNLSAHYLLTGARNAVNVRRATQAGRGGDPRALDGVRARGPRAARGSSPETWDEDWGDTRQAHRRRRRRLPRGGRRWARRLPDARARRDGALHVAPRPRPAAGTAARRREGAAPRLRRARAGRGRARISLTSCSTTNRRAKVWRRLGFEPVETLMAPPLDALDLRLA